MTETVKALIHDELENENKKLKELLQESIQLLEKYNLKLKVGDFYENNTYMSSYKN
ncbi:hypothetical protein [Clostridium felsineum]|uniref:hypothetical protein n=1 Tax=Clostridium felsineum TaxID=36839 RepID=UPI0009CC36B5|nr:hypothetical protein [Clostridium felsineum]URZ15407.1 hypothetical protein CLFE_014470 [Clostridium felsineum DSM 794]